MSALKVLVNNLIKKKFDGKKRKEKAINVLIGFFSFSIKVMSKFS